jgi:hypothetical protein
MTGWQWIGKYVEGSCGSLNPKNISPDSPCPGRDTNCVPVLPLRELSSWFAMHQFIFRLQSVLPAHTVTPSNRKQLGRWRHVTGRADSNCSEDCLTLATQPLQSFTTFGPSRSTTQHHVPADTYLLQHPLRNAHTASGHIFCHPDFTQFTTNNYHILSY